MRTTQGVARRKRAVRLFTARDTLIGRLARPAAHMQVTLAAHNGVAEGHLVPTELEGRSSADLETGWGGLPVVDPVPEAPIVPLVPAVLAPVPWNGPAPAVAEIPPVWVDPHPLSVIANGQLPARDITAAVTASGAPTVSAPVGVGMRVSAPPATEASSAPGSFSLAAWLARRVATVPMTQPLARDLRTSEGVLEWALLVFFGVAAVIPNGLTWTQSGTYMTIVAGMKSTRRLIVKVVALQKSAGLGGAITPAALTELTDVASQAGSTAPAVRTDVQALAADLHLLPTDAEEAGHGPADVLSSAPPQRTFRGDPRRVAS